MPTATCYTYKAELGHLFNIVADRNVPLRHVFNILIQGHFRF